MLIIGLMVIALVCLAVGLALPSSAWLVASLIATAGAGYLVWKMRSGIAPAPAGTSPGVVGEPAGVDSRDDRSDADDLSRVDDLSSADDRANRDAETTTIARIAAESDVGTRAQYAADDSTQVFAAVPADDDDDADDDADGGDVWVIDGRPRYHLGSCPIIQGQDAEPIPLEQAVEDGFMPCSLCEPNMARTAH